MQGLQTSQVGQQGADCKVQGLEDQDSPADRAQVYGLPGGAQATLQVEQNQAIPAANARCSS